LKWFHAVFIGLCILLAVFVAAWAFEQADWLLALAAVAGGAALIMYRRAFLRRASALERHS